MLPCCLEYLESPEAHPDFEQQIADLRQDTLGQDAVRSSSVVQKCGVGQHHWNDYSDLLLECRDCASQFACHVIWGSGGVNSFRALNIAPCYADQGSGGDIFWYFLGPKIVPCYTDPGSGEDSCFVLPGPRAAPNSPQQPSTASNIAL